MILEREERRCERRSVSLLLIKCGRGYCGRWCCPQSSANRHSWEVTLVRLSALGRPGLSLAPCPGSFDDRPHHCVRYARKDPGCKGADESHCLSSRWIGPHTLTLTTCHGLFHRARVYTQGRAALDDDAAHPDAIGSVLLRTQKADQQLAGPDDQLRESEPEHPRPLSFDDVESSPRVIGHFRVLVFGGGGGVFKAALTASSN